MMMFITMAVTYHLPISETSNAHRIGERVEKPSSREKREHIFVQHRGARRLLTPEAHSTLVDRTYGSSMR